MTDFTPEHYLAAARIAYPGCRTQINAIGHAIVLVAGVWNTFNEATIHDYHYRALREALDKEYRIAIYWWGDAWLSEPNIDRDYGIPCMDGDDITNLMMKNVVALVEAGVVE